MKIDASHIVDSRFSPIVQQHGNRSVNAVLGYLDGKYRPLGEWSSRKYKCAILDDPDHTNPYFKFGDPHPVPAGKWMGWPEKHWKISKSRWEQMSVRERAVLECKEQVRRSSKAMLFFGTTPGDGSNEFAPKASART